MMLDNSTYDKVKLIYKLSRMIWFIDKHALVDSTNAGDKECMSNLVNLKKDLEKHLEKLQQSVCIISQ